MGLAKHLYLVGYRGSGKTSVARCLADKLGMPCVDTDAWIETHTGSTIRDYFASHGESAFRDVESLAIKTLENEPPHIVSLGGGAILREENRQSFQKAGWVVWLRASAEELARRIAGDPTTADRRPALSKLSGYDEIVQLLEVREPIYHQVSHFVVETEGKTPENIAEEILSWIAGMEAPSIATPQ